MRKPCVKPPLIIEVLEDKTLPSGISFDLLSDHLRLDKGDLLQSHLAAAQSPQTGITGRLKDLTRTEVVLPPLRRDADVNQHLQGSSQYMCVQTNSAYDALTSVIAHLPQPSVPRQREALWNPDLGAIEPITEPLGDPPIANANLEQYIPLNSDNDNCSPMVTTNDSIYQAHIPQFYDFQKSGYGVDDDLIALRMDRADQPPYLAWAGVLQYKLEVQDNGPDSSANPKVEKLKVWMDNTKETAAVFGNWSTRSLLKNQVLCATGVLYSAHPCRFSVIMHSPTAHRLFETVTIRVLQQAPIGLVKISEESNYYQEPVLFLEGVKPGMQAREYTLTFSLRVQLPTGSSTIPYRPVDVTVTPVVKDMFPSILIKPRIVRDGSNIWVRGSMAWEAQVTSEYDAINYNDGYVQNRFTPKFVQHLTADKPQLDNGTYDGYQDTTSKVQFVINPDSPGPNRVYPFVDNSNSDHPYYLLEPPKTVWRDQRTASFKSNDNPAIKVQREDSTNFIKLGSRWEFKTELVWAHRQPIMDAPQYVESTQDVLYPLGFFTWHVTFDWDQSRGFGANDELLKDTNYVKDYTPQYPYVPTLANQARKWVYYQ